VAAIRLNNLGVAEMNRGRTGEAYDLFRHAWQRDSSLFPARLNEGIALLNAQRFDEAREVLLDATRRQPDSARAWYNLGILYRNTAQADAAIEAFERATRIDPGDADALYFMGQLNAQIMRYDQAITWYERCLALDSFHVPRSSDSHASISFPAMMTRPFISIASISSPSKLGKPISLPTVSGGLFDGQTRRRCSRGARAIRRSIFIRAEQAGLASNLACNPIIPTTCRCSVQERALLISIKTVVPIFCSEVCGASFFTGMSGNLLDVTGAPG
jgi:tetratricopeptide (TPR) repeat protein